jgi:D-alanyl-D-alanine carboxypeptidase
MILSAAKSLRTSILAAGLVTASLCGQSAHAERYASIVIDTTTDTVLHARHADADRYPASLTKVMTLFMVFDEMEAGRLSATTMMSVSSNAAAQPPSKLGLKRGDTISTHDAIHALVTKSANDVAVVIAEHIGGTEERFAALMTTKARALGMTNTQFRNASGLPNSRQVSTARDMALLADAIMDEHGAYYHYFSLREFTWGNRTYKNYNELLGSVDGVDGLKTGYTRASGYNLMASAVRGDTRIITVMLGGRTSRARNNHVAELIEAAYESLATPPTNDGSMRTHIAFESVRQPIDPNAAAVPTLNGRPFPLGEGDAQ